MVSNREISSHSRDLRAEIDYCSKHIKRLEFQTFYFSSLSHPWSYIDKNLNYKTVD